MRIKQILHFLRFARKDVFRECANMNTQCLQAFQTDCSQRGRLRKRSRHYTVLAGEHSKICIISKN